MLIVDDDACTWFALTGLPENCGMNVSVADNAAMPCTGAMRLAQLLHWLNVEDKPGEGAAAGQMG